MSKKKKILFIASDNFRGSGAFISMTVLNTILREQYGVYTEVIIPAKDIGDGVDLLCENGIPYKKIRSFNWCQEVGKKRDAKYWGKTVIKNVVNKIAVYRISKYIKTKGFDLVHINTSYSYVGALAAHKAGVKLVWHLREFLEEDQKMEIQNKEKGYALINSADRIVAISKSIQDKYKDIFDEKRMTVIYNGIAIDKFYAPEHALFSRKPVVGLCVGRVTEKKGQFEVVQALADSRCEAMELWLVGNADADEKEKIEKFAAQKGIINRIKFLGAKNDVETYYRKADVYFMTSTAEAFGRVTVEAMLSGCLVVGANCGATKELIENEETGFLYEKGNVAQLGDTITGILNQSEQMKSIAKRGQEAAVSNFSAKKNAENIYQLYCDILK